jgi:hypothetical protein
MQFDVTLRRAQVAQELAQLEAECGPAKGHDEPR